VPDPPGESFWTGGITPCGSGAQCIEARRVGVSAAFFLSIESQQTGFFVYRMYKAAFGNLPGKPVAVSRAGFLPDARLIGDGVIVGQVGWAQLLESNKQAFALAFVRRPAFQSVHGGQDANTYVRSLFVNAGVVPTDAERVAAIIRPLYACRATRQTHGDVSPDAG